jgi:uncharacterized membrane protein (DUF373 family)
MPADRDREPGMAWREGLATGRTRWMTLTPYYKFEQVIVLILTGLIAVVTIAAVWSLALKVLFDLVLSDEYDVTDPAAFQAVFGMVFTVIIALEFKRSLLVLAERRDTVVQVRTVILIAMLAVVRKLIILDLAATDAQHLLALAAAILALGAVYWLVRDQDRRGARVAATRSHRHGPIIDARGLSALRRGQPPSGGAAGGAGQVRPVPPTAVRGQALSGRYRQLRAPQNPQRHTGRGRLLGPLVWAMPGYGARL